ncbi:MAG: imidazoleglycerol-phosphate dehydratase HisB [Fibrobacterota bacterium]
MEKRHVTLKRKTTETDIALSFSLDGSGQYSVSTGIGFFDHMLELFAKHGGFDLTLTGTGDLKVDAHHTMEDVGICLGEAIAQALGDKKGIRRYGFFILPMDEALARAVIDLGGRPYLVLNAVLPPAETGAFPPELVSDFFKAVSDSGKLNLHLELLYGRNSHHCIEALFKAFARALAHACAFHGDRGALPSTKGLL